ncbi:hypothetical protein DID96_33105 [Burkholderia sp. Bp8963]|uniref:hypothetical protein n=1 Tax=Burkholderia sp. Bp8963 TaxID=2184547 RepID=UPI000F59EF94|nr:hypothetical protein [Burkholderia sp. Bp8963]RQS61525.1 hypothetical protein DID96_33105 [Burkholderia sp. Bp8963]
MAKHLIISTAIAFIAFSGVIASASAQQQAPSVIHQESALTAGGGSRAADAASGPAYTAQLPARSNEAGNGGRATAATKAVVPAINAPAGHDAPPESQCVGPASFCNPYFGS